MPTEIEKLRAWLEKGAEVDAIDTLGNSRLHRAIMCDDAEQAALLLSYGACSSLPNQADVTPCDFARHLNRAACRPLFNLPIRKEVLFSSSGKDPYPVSITDIEALENYSHLDSLEFPHPDLIAYTRHMVTHHLDPLQKSEGEALGHRFCKEILLSHLPDVAVMHVNNLVGSGLFSCTTLPIGAFVGEYIGQVVPFAPKSDPSYQLKYLIDAESSRALVIDAKEKGGLLRFSNHSSTPNIEPVIAYLNNLIHVIFLTTRKILPGEQLCYDYGPGYWSQGQKQHTL